MPPVKKCYTYSIQTISKKVINFKIFFIVKPETKEIDGEKYNLFVFSYDSTDVIGYVRYDSLNKEMFFINKDYGSLHPCNNINKVQRLFCFFRTKSEICAAGALGADLTILSRKHRKAFSMKVIHNLLSSDMDYVDQLIFYKNLYPDQIVLFHHFTDKFIVLNANSY